MIQLACTTTTLASTTPKWASSSNPIAWNRYAYVHSSPVNYTDSTGHVIDTLLDAYDLASNVGSCLGDSDALSCYMAPVSAVFLVVPGLTDGGLGDNAIRAARGVENTMVIGL